MHIKDVFSFWKSLKDKEHVQVLEGKDFEMNKDPCLTSVSYAICSISPSPRRKLYSDTLKLFRQSSGRSRVYLVDILFPDTTSTNGCKERHDVDSLGTREYRDPHE